MGKKSLLGLVAAVIVFCISGVLQASVTYTVVGAQNTGTNHGVSTGLYINAGDRLVITCDPLDMWSSRPGVTHNAEPGNAIGWWTYNGLSGWVGTLVGQIGSGSFFSVGLEFDGIVSTSGALTLYNFDGIWQDNDGSVTAAIEVNPVPEPATIAFLALGGLMFRKPE